MLTCETLQNILCWVIDVLLRCAPLPKPTFSPCTITLHNKTSKLFGKRRSKGIFCIFSSPKVLCASYSFSHFFPLQELHYYRRAASCKSLSLGSRLNLPTLLISIKTALAEPQICLPHWLNETPTGQALSLALPQQFEDNSPNKCNSPHQR